MLDNWSKTFQLVLVFRRWCTHVLKTRRTMFASGSPSCNGDSNNNLGHMPGSSCAAVHALNNSCAAVHALNSSCAAVHTLAATALRWLRAGTSGGRRVSTGDFADGVRKLLNGTWEVAGMSAGDFSSGAQRYRLAACSVTPGGCRHECWGLSSGAQRYRLAACSECWRTVRHKCSTDFCTAAVPTRCQ